MIGAPVYAIRDVAEHDLIARAKAPISASFFSVVEADLWWAFGASAVRNAAGRSLSLAMESALVHEELKVM